MLKFELLLELGLELDIDQTLELLSCCGCLATFTTERKPQQPVTSQPLELSLSLRRVQVMHGLKHLSPYTNNARAPLRDCIIRIIRLETYRNMYNT